MKFKNQRYFVIALLLVFISVGCKESTKTTEQTPNQVSQVSTNETKNEVLTSKMTKADKKKYYNSSNNVVFEIKYKPDGFKLRTAASKLLWKIKLYDTKIKISDNEENLNPYEIKILSNQEAKLEKDGTVLARTSYNIDKKEQVISSNTTGAPEFYKKSYAPSLLISQISEIPEQQKQILINELILKGY